MAISAALNSAKRRSKRGSPSITLKSSTVTILILSFGEMFVNRMKLDIKQAYKSNSDGTDQNTKVTADYAAFVKAFREKKGDMTLKEAIDLLGADCFEVDKTFKGANMERFVRIILDGMTSIPDTVDKETLIRQIMNRLERYNLIVDATLDWNTAIPTQQ